MADRPKFIEGQENWGPDHIPLPSGSYLHKPTLFQWNPRACHKCGETVFNIYPAGMGVSCPKCCKVPRHPDTRAPYPVMGKFDMTTLTVVQVFSVRVTDGPEDEGR